MKFLHTADWHLGRRLHGQDLAEEMNASLNEILRLIREHRVDALVHAGDVFDSGTPPHHAMKQYYSFLKRAVAAGCGTIIITGGNHDSPTALNAPKDLLQALNIHVVGCATESIADEVVPIQNTGGDILGYCCAVPFLRDKDLRYSVPGESDAKRSKRIIAGIRQHYDNVVQEAEKVNTQGLPLIATGHLFAQGGAAGDLDGKKEQIHVGNLGQIGADIFPDSLAYVALGHLHRSQTVGQQSHIRYSGSPVPLDFSERDDANHVHIVECLPGKVATTQTIELPRFRCLVRFSGTFAEAERAIRDFDTTAHKLSIYAEVHLTPDDNAKASLMDVKGHFNTVAKDHHGDKMYILKVPSIHTSGASAFDDSHTIALEEVSPTDIFIKRLENEGYDSNQKNELLQTFQELLELVAEDGVSV
jgi:DNA repair protein SbcD/Mre11